MSRTKGVLKKDNPSGMSRREAVKLTAAVAAFGAALGFNAAAGEPSGSAQTRFKIEKMAFKFYHGDLLLHTFSLPINVCEEVTAGNKIAIKFYQDNLLQTGDIPFSFNF